MKYINLGRFTTIIKTLLLITLLIKSAYLNAISFKDLKISVDNEKTAVAKQQILDSKLKHLPKYSLEEQAHYWQIVGKNQATLLDQQASIDAFSKAIDIRINNEFLLSEDLVADLINRSHSKHNLSPGVKAECSDVELAVFYAKQLTDPKVLPGILAVYAKCLYSSDQSITEPIKLLNKALSLAKEAQLPPSEQATIYSQTSFIYQKGFLFEDAYKATLNAYQMWIKAENDLGEYFMLDLLISTSIKMNDFKQAYKHIDDLKEFKIKHPEHISIAFIIHYRKGDLAKTQDNWDEAIGHYEKAIAEQNNMQGKAYVKAAYEKLIFAYFRSNKISQSKALLEEFEIKFPNKPIRLPEALVIKSLLNDQAQNALNQSFDLLKNEQVRRQLFIKDSIASAAQEHNDNLKQLNNVLLEQRFKYSIIISVLIIIMLFIFVVYQHKKRKLLKKEKNITTRLLEDKNKLLTEVSHELRTPLTVLQIEVETLQHDFSDDIEASYNALRNKIRDMNHLIDDISLLAKSDTATLNFNYSEVNIKQFISDIEIDISRYIISKGFKYEKALSIPSSFNIKIDEAKIKQVLLNLVNNSIAYSDLPGTIKFSSFIKNTQLIIRLSDSAPTVNTAQLKLIFERLYRVESSRSRSTGGSGFGLAICKTIIESHNGLISAKQSRLGGVSIEIKLPFN